MREILRQAGFFMLGVFSLFYIIFSRNFAEIHAQVSFLNFPVFAGEILLLICLILSSFVFDFRSIKGWRWGVVFYFVCIILKAFWGYSLWGPLAFRHAALFYYPIFIFFGFVFYNKAFLSEPLKIFVVFLILGLCITGYFYGYWTLTLWIIAFILAKSLRHKVIKYFFYAGLSVIIFLSYKILIVTSRTFIVGNITAVVFLAITLLSMGKIKIFYKAAIVGAIFILLAAFAFKHSTINASGTILDMGGITSRYKVFDGVIKTRRPHYAPQDLKDIKLFNPEKSFKLNSVSDEKPQRGAPEVVGSFDKSIEKKKVIAPVNNDVRSSKPIMEIRDVEDAYDNTLFRIFIWRDMIVEFSRHWPVLGFSFGKPIRSESLEILNWADREWKRDGWIEPHNSYLNMLYRAGILGVVLIGFLIWQFCHMITGFIALKSSPGVLLCSVLIIWLAAANFLPILELPYNAIPFWALWGAALGYLKELKSR